VVQRTFTHDFSGECLAQVKEAKTNAGTASQAKHYSGKCRQSCNRTTK
jgi:hypothetical protein